MEFKDIEEIDTNKMFKVYDQWPEIAKNYFRKRFTKLNFQNIENIVFVGMGGSGAIGDVFASILSKTNLRVSVIKGYNFPKHVDKKTLIIAISISGNTDETNSILKESINYNCKILGISSGGKMEEFCNQHKLEFRKVKRFNSPRESFAAFLFSLLNILSPIIPMKPNDIDEAIDEMFKLRKVIATENLTETNLSLKLAKWIDHTPIIYYPFGFESVAIRFKSSLQENAKSHVIIEDVMEASHNGIVAWEKKSKIKPILIRGPNDHPKTFQKYEIFKRYFQEKKIDFYEIFSIDGNILSKIVNLIYLLDFCSIYKAVLDKTNPFPVKSIDYIKEKISNEGLE